MALEHIWAKQAIWIWKETTRWTKASVGFWVAKTGWAWLNPNVAFINEESGIWRIETVRDSRKVKEWSKLEMEGILTDKSTGILLLWVFWSVSNSTVETWVYKHSYSVDNSNTHTSFTVYNADDVIGWSNQTEVATYMVMDSFEIEAAAGEYWKFNMSMTWRKITEDSEETPSFTWENKFSFDDVSVKIVQAANKAWAISALVWATPIKLNRFRIAFGKNIMENQELWSADIADIFNQNFTIEWDFDAVYRDRSNYDLMDWGWKYYMEVVIKNTNVTIWTVNNPTLRILLNKTSFQTWSKTWDINTIVNQTVWFVWEFNETDTEMVTCELTNTTATY